MWTGSGNLQVYSQAVDRFCEAGSGSLRVDVMKTPRPLPVPLRRGVFSRRQAQEYGVPPKRLRARDIIPVARGLYLWAHAEDSESTHPGTTHPGTTRPGTTSTPDLRHLRALQDGYQDSWFSHTTAAQLFGLRLPSRWQHDETIHISRLLISTTVTRAPELRSHAVVVNDGEVVTHLGLHVSRPARIFFDLMDRLNERELVALGDQLVRHPRPGLDAHTTPWETPASLVEVVGSHRKTRGIVTGRRAAARVRIGADSHPETMLRLAIEDAGLPEPTLQVRPSPRSVYTGDLGYEDAKIVLQYDGGTHFTAQQQASDQRRNHAFAHDGWLVILVNVEDLREDFRHVIDRLASALDARSP